MDHTYKMHVKSEASLHPVLMSEAPVRPLSLLVSLVYVLFLPSLSAHSKIFFFFFRKKYTYLLIYHVCIYTHIGARSCARHTCRGQTTAGGYHFSPPCGSQALTKVVRIGDKTGFTC